MHTTFETNKENFRNAISDIAERATSFEEFQRLLKAEYGILVKDHRGRFSYLPADRQKFISARALGSNYDRDRLLRIFAENARNVNRTIRSSNAWQQPTRNCMRTIWSGRRNNGGFCTKIRYR